MKNPKVKSNNGNYVASINTEAIRSHKTADSFLTYVKERQHLYAAFNRNDEAIRETWQKAQPKQEELKPDGKKTAPPKEQV